MGEKQLSYEAYTIGWICALPIEQTAAVYMLDERHRDLRNPANDQNAYTLGRVGKHNVVIAGLPKGRIGNNNSATVATRLASTFPNIRIGLMVGVGGGTPKKTQLGDVVISVPGDRESGVIQWDMGKAEFGGQFRRTQPLAPPPPVLLTSLSKFDAERGTSYANMHSYLDRLKDQPYIDESFLKSDSLEDILYEPTYCHVDMEGDCSRCDKTKIVKRRLRRDKTTIHYGLIASGNKVIKDAILRDDLYREYGVLCMEMEAAGLMNDFPCVAIRGICDYADSHANNEWQNYAATVAAACAKAFLMVVPEQELYKLQLAQGKLTLEDAWLDHCAKLISSTSLNRS
jgi:nucleoside phosphorylase